MHVGCYHFSSNDLETETSPGNITGRTEHLRNCGKAVIGRNYLFFGLKRNECYFGSNNVTDFIVGGPSDVCEGEGGDYINVYQVVEKDQFDLSVRMIETCGADFCKEERDLVCSGNVHSVYQLTIALKLIFFSLWLIV